MPWLQSVSRTVPLGFAFVPSESACRQLVAQHKKLDAQHPSGFLLTDNAAHSLPHISLWQGQYRASALACIEGTTRDVCAVFARQPATITLQPPTLWLDQIVFVDTVFAPETDLRAWQFELMQRLEPYRARERQPADPQPLAGLGGNEQISMATHGYPFFGDALRPHITFGRLDTNKDSWPRTAVELADAPIFRRAVSCPRFVVFEVGLYGAMKKIVADIALSAGDAPRQQVARQEA